MIVPETAQRPAVTQVDDPSSRVADASAPGEKTVVVAGAGPAGLATAAMLERRRVPALVIERASKVASSWRTRYDSLILNTPRLTSTLPGYRIPRRYGRWPSRDAIVEYLEEYARRHELRIEFGNELRRVDREDDTWLLRTSSGDLRARNVVIATGHDVEPLLPDWPGRAGYAGELLHSADYRRPDPFRGRDVLVVGPNTSGSEIAYELVSQGAARVWVSMRTPPYVSRREWPPGIPVNTTAVMLDLLPDRMADRIAALGPWAMYGNLSKHGLPPSPHGAQTTAKVRHQGALVDNGFVDAVKDGRIELVAAVEAFDGPDVLLADGSRIQPDVVIAATGYSRGLEPIVGHLGVLDETGFPRVLADETHPNAPRLYFNGYYATISGGMRHMRRHARRIARAIAQERARA
jgi:putative flavoprotein involved in K+ transport